MHLKISLIKAKKEAARSKCWHSAHRLGSRMSASLLICNMEIIIKPAWRLQEGLSITGVVLASCRHTVGAY